MPARPCVVFIPATPGGTHCLNVTASSSLEAAAVALEHHHIKNLADDLVLTVVVDGKSSLLAGFDEHNAKQPTFQHTVGQVKVWRSERSTH